MRSKLATRFVVTFCLVAAAGAELRAEKTKRAYEVSQIATVEGSRVRWVPARAEVTLPTGWTVWEDTGLDGTDLKLMGPEQRATLVITSAKSTDHARVGQKIADNLVAQSGDTTHESKAETTVGGKKAVRFVLRVVDGELIVKYAITAFAVGDRTYVLTGFGPAPFFEEGTRDFDAIAASFRVAE